MHGNKNIKVAIKYATGALIKSLFHNPIPMSLKGASNHKIAVKAVYFRKGKSNRSGYETVSKSTYRSVTYDENFNRIAK